MQYEVVIGLEMHAELATKTKVFCACKNEFGSLPNTNCCEVCTGMPGALPTLNKQAVDFTIKAGLATHCEINNIFYFERKSYFYPDLAKAYQISQMVLPLCVNGYVEIADDNGNNKKIRLNRIHLEEDAGKLTHMGRTSMVDYNRGGVPLIETVTEPDIRSVGEAIRFLEALKEIYKFIGVSECKMEQGMLRCDVNISLREKGASEYGKKTEMKNLNSFKAIERAIKFEVARQEALLNAGKTIPQETLRWDDETGENYSMRSKENAHDYRYFKDPDLLCYKVSKEYVENLRKELPILPSEKKKEYVNKYNLTEYDAGQITKSAETINFFEEAISVYNNPKIICNWMLNELFKKLNVNSEIEESVKIPISATNFAKLAELYVNNKVSQAGSRKILDELFIADKNPEQIMKELGLEIVSDSGVVEKIVKEIISANAQAVLDYKSGNAKALAFFVGQTMKATKGQASASVVNEIIKKLLD